MALPGRIARLKAANILCILTFGEWLVVFSNVNSYYASTARALLNLGAQILIVGGKRKESLIINIEFYKNFLQKQVFILDVTSLNLSVNLFIGMGGGHNTSAGVNGKGNIEDTFEECICLLKKKLLI